VVFRQRKRIDVADTGPASTSLGVPGLSSHDALAEAAARTVDRVAAMKNGKEDVMII
jgi:hypothetical protein